LQSPKILKQNFTRLLHKSAEEHSIILN